MVEIVERLRRRTLKECQGQGVMPKIVPDEDCIEAADEIERLRTGNRLHLELAEIKEAEIERLRKSLQSAHDNLEGLVRDVYAAYANTKCALKGDE